MALVIGTNSYGDAAGANTYFADRYGSEWKEVPTPDVDPLLITATLFMDNIFAWYGKKALDSQALEHPRYDEEDSSPSVPTKIVQASYELALFLYSYGTEIYGNPKATRLDKIWTEYWNGSVQLPLIVTSLISEYGVIKSVDSDVSMVDLVR